MKVKMFNRKILLKYIQKINVYVWEVFFVILLKIMLKLQKYLVVKQQKKSNVIFSKKSLE